MKSEPHVPFVNGHSSVYIPQCTKAAFKNGTVVPWNNVVRHGIWRWLSLLLNLFYLSAFDLGKALPGFLPTAVVRIGSQNHSDDEVTDRVPEAWDASSPSAPQT